MLFAPSFSGADCTAKAVMIQAGENPVCGVEAVKRFLQRSWQRELLRWRQCGTGSERLPESVRKWRSVNSSTLQARKGEPVSFRGDVTEMRKLNSNG